MIIQHNIMALNAHRQLGGNNSLVQKNLEKLSSGFKINRAGDDAAGLAISEKMRAQITGLTRAQSNAQDGISLVQTAEGALTEVHSMLNRMVDLSTQSANGTLKDDDRQKIQDEMNALTEEITRISKSTNFNGINLLDGSLSGTSEGKVTGGKIINFTNATAALKGKDMSSTKLSDITATIKNKITVDGTEIEVDWSSLTQEDVAKLAKDHSGTATDQASADVLAKYINASIDKHNKENGTDVKNIAVTGAAGGFTFTSGSTDKTSGVSFAATNDKSLMGVLFNNIASATVTSTESFASGITAPTAGDTYMMEINGQKIQITSIAAGGGGTDGTGSVTADNMAAGLETEIRAALTSYIATSGSTDFVPTDITVSLNKDGKLEVKGLEGMKISFTDKEGSSVAKNMGLTADTISGGAGGLTLQIGDTGDDFNKVTVSVEDMSATGLGVAGIKVTKQGVSDAAIASIKSAINKVSTNRSAMGALQNRLEHTINNLSVATENMTAAESRIRDVDMAKEMMHFTKNNVLSQAAQAMLAQANQQPQQVLQLLR